MDTRGKLIEILKRIDANGDACIAGIAALADLLVENGVTVQQWVPVADHLPDDSGDVIIGKVNSEGKFTFVANTEYSNRHKLFNVYDYFSAKEAARTAVHPDFWMPMPVLYKEEHGEA